MLQTACILTHLASGRGVVLLCYLDDCRDKKDLCSVLLLPCGLMCIQTSEKLMRGKHKKGVGKRQWAEEYGRYSLAAAGVFAHGKLVICLKLNLNINSGTRYLHFSHTADAQSSSALGNIPFRL